MVRQLNITLKKFSYKYLPYEERLLLQEARGIGDVLSRQPGAVRVQARPSDTNELVTRLHKLTYFSHFSIGQGPPLPTQQFLLETTANGNGTGTRQSTRYSTHGLHEYKGKFHPQIARYLMSEAGLSADSVVLDPFAGSGTVLVEAVHYGCNSVGIEPNPLAVLVANAKIKMLTCPDRELQNFRRVVDSAIRELPARKNHIGALSVELGLTDHHLKYLHSWFAPKILVKLLAFRALCRRSLRPEWSLVADALASAITREVSHQDPADLRIRRRKLPLTDAPVAEFLTGSLQAAVERAIAARKLVFVKPALVHEFLGDGREPSSESLLSLRTVGKERVDAIITSPPYATALPYVDTSRLSLVLLGACSPSELRVLEKLQIGNREISPSDRKRLEQTIESKLGDLPPKVGEFVCSLLSALRKGNAGFRKRNTPALLTEYFCDMRTVLLEMRKLLSRTGVGFWLVGPNKTQVDDKWLRIDTPNWIASIAQSVGYWTHLEPLDAYQRFGLHQRNGIRQEFLITLRPN